MARMEDTRLPKYVMFGELVGGAGCVGGRKKSAWGVSCGTTSELSASKPTSGRLRNVSWRNKSLQGRTKNSPKQAGSSCFAHHS